MSRLSVRELVLNNCIAEHESLRHLQYASTALVSLEPLRRVERVTLDVDRSDLTIPVTDHLAFVEVRSAEQSIIRLRDEHSVQIEGRCRYTRFGKFWCMTHLHGASRQFLSVRPLQEDVEFVPLLSSLNHPTPFSLHESLLRSMAVVERIITSYKREDIDDKTAVCIRDALMQSIRDDLLTTAVDHGFISTKQRDSYLKQKAKSAA